MNVLLLHGLPGDANDWRPVAERLAAAGARPLRPDRPGWGASVEPPGDIDRNVAAAVDVLDEAGAGAAVVAGHSYGSLIALAMAEQVPGRVAGLALVSPFGPGSLGAVGRAFASPRLGPLLIALQLGVGGIAQSAPPLRQLIGRRYDLADEALRARGRAWLGARARAAFFLEQREIVARLEPLLDAALRVRAPALVLVGSRDRATGTHPALALAESIPGARLVVVPRAGHYLPLSHPHAVAAELARLAREVSAVPAA